VQVRVSNGLARRRANIDAYVVAVRQRLLFDTLPNRRKKSPDGGLFLAGKPEKISFVPQGNNQAVAVV
jgi:hypothetical protein